MKLKRTQKVAVLGDLALDRYVIGGTHRISSEAPIPVLAATARRVNMACAGNTAGNIAAMGVKPFMLGCLGNGEYADAFKKTAFAQGISLNYTVTIPQDMNAKTRLMAQGQQIARYDEEKKITFTPELREELKENLKKARKETDIIILSDYGYYNVDEQMIALVADLWQDGTIIHDPQAFHPVNLTGVTAITPNLKEAMYILGNTTAKNTDEDTQDLANQLIEKFNLQYVLFTRSEKGMSLYEKDGTAHHAPAHAQEVFDVSGAGDSVVAAFATALAKGFSRPEAMELANIAGSVAVTKTGVQTVTWEEITTFKAHLTAA